MPERHMSRRVPHSAAERPGSRRDRVALALAATAAGLAIAALANRRLARQAERLNPPSGRCIEVHGVRLHYLDRGSGPVLQEEQLLVGSRERQIAPTRASAARAAAERRVSDDDVRRPQRGGVVGERIAMDELSLHAVQENVHQAQAVGVAFDLNRLIVRRLLLVGRLGVFAGDVFLR